MKMRKTEQRNSTPARADRGLQLAVAAATLGMALGMNVDAAFASLKPAETQAGDSRLAPQPIRLAAGYLKMGDIKGEAQDKDHKQQPGALSPPVSKPGAGNQLPAVQQQKVQPSAMQQKVRAQGGAKKAAEKNKGSHSGGAVPAEEFSLNYEKIKMK